jgi:hypothetical protein
MYRSYPAAEKKQVWQDKVTQVISLNSWSQEQESKLNDLTQNIDNS